MTVDKFGSHISQKHSDNFGYYQLYIPLYVRDTAKTFFLGTDMSVLTYKINELTNTWNFPISQATIQKCRVYNVAIKFIINDHIVDSLEGETLTIGDTILIVRSLESKPTGDGFIELIIKAPVFEDEYE